MEAFAVRQFVQQFKHSAFLAGQAKRQLKCAARFQHCGLGFVGAVVIGKQPLAVVPMKLDLQWQAGQPVRRAHWTIKMDFMLIGRKVVGIALLLQGSSAANRKRHFFKLLKRQDHLLPG